MAPLYRQDGKLIKIGGKLATHADCCCGGACEDCCENPFGEIPLIDVDFGVGGLSNGSYCSGSETWCTDLSGVVEIAWNDYCAWTYGGVSGDVCGEIASVHDVELTIRTSGEDCFWELVVFFRPADPDTYDTGSVTYRSAPKTFVEADCDLSSSITLTKVGGSEDWGNWCSGTLPGTVTIEATP